MKGLRKWLFIMGVGMMIVGGVMQAEEAARPHETPWLDKVIEKFPDLAPHAQAIKAKQEEMIRLHAQLKQTKEEIKRLREELKHAVQAKRPQRKKGERPPAK